MSKICKECHILKPDYKFTGKSKICHLCYNISEYNVISNEPVSVSRKSYLKCKYDLTPSEYNIKLKDQYCRCAICEEFQLDPTKKLFVDHCHTSGEVRGLLCHRCNAALGLLREDKEIAIRLINYIDKYEFLKNPQNLTNKEKL